MDFRRFAYLGFGLAVAGIALDANATDYPISIKNGETVELIRPSNVANCHSTLASTPTAEMLLGHPNLSIVLKAAQVRPMVSECKEEVPGAIISLVANGITEPSTAIIVVRWHYKFQKGGGWSRGRKYVVSISP
jgi:hypothetical protein